MFTLRFPLLRSACAAGLCLLLGACATTAPAPVVQTHADAQIRYDKYTSFAVQTPASASRHPLATPMMLRQVRERAAAAFAGKGLAATTPEAAELWVLVHGAVVEKIDITDWGYTYGRFGRRWSHQYDIDQFQEGALTVDVIDARTKELIWRGSITGRLAESPTPATVLAAVDTVTARYPL